jgi:hypothetical protein
MPSVIGVWRLVATSAVDAEGREAAPPFGKRPMGVIIFEAERMIAVSVDASVSLPEGAPSRAFGAYSGRYRFDGVELVTDVDSASGPDFTGPQVRHIRFESPTRMVITPVDTALGRETGMRLVWEKVG